MFIIIPFLRCLFQLSKFPEGIMSIWRFLNKKRLLKDAPQKSPIPVKYYPQKGLQRMLVEEMNMVA